MRHLSKYGWRIQLHIVLVQNTYQLIKGFPGDPPDWDFIAQIGDDKRYVRRRRVDAAKSKLRIPTVKTIEPDLLDLDKKTIEKIMTGEKVHNF